MKEGYRLTGIHPSNLNRNWTSWGSCWDGDTDSGNWSGIWDSGSLTNWVMQMLLVWRPVVFLSPCSTKSLMESSGPYLYNSHFQLGQFWSQGNLSVSGDIFDLHNSGSTTGIMWTGTTDAAITHSTDFHNKWCSDSKCQ